MTLLPPDARWIRSLRNMLLDTSIDDKSISTKLLDKDHMGAWITAFTDKTVDNNISLVACAMLPLTVTSTNLAAKKVCLDLVITELSECNAECLRLNPW
jgi:hypothetical protein